MSPLLVRRAVPADRAALGTLGALLMRLHYDFDRQRFMDPGPNSEAGYAEFLCSQLDDPNVGIFVADREGTIVGYVYAAVEPQSWKDLRDRAGYIHDIFVDVEARRTGVARELLEAALQWLRGRGVPRVLLGTAVENAGAQALFARAGFRKTMIEMTREL